MIDKRSPCKHLGLVGVRKNPDSRRGEYVLSVSANVEYLTGTTLYLLRIKLVTQIFVIMLSYYYLC